MGSVASRALALLAGVVLTTGGAAAQSTVWHLTLETQWLGPVETHVQVTRDGDRLEAHSLSGASDRVRQLPGAPQSGQRAADGLFAFTAEATGEGAFRGSLVAPWPGDGIELVFAEDRATGAILGGRLAGAISGSRRAEARPLRDYRGVVDALRGVVADKVYRPRELETDAYRSFLKTIQTIAGDATDDFDLLLGFAWGWTGDPFSHFELRRSARTAEEAMAFFDDYRVGYRAARLTFHGDIAVLTVDTMMGLDTIEQIDAAYDGIAEAGSKALIIDLRGNTGGAFAIKPLVEHVIDEPLDVGCFLSQRWNASHEGLPDPQTLASIAPWEGWSIIAFWRSVQDEGVLRIQLAPDEPRFRGPVFVLVDEVSASATELAADALRMSGRATLIGGRTAGEMLSQSMFDVSDGFLVSLPVADYYSSVTGRIEGHGVPVDVEVPGAEAMARALEMAEKALH